MKTTHPESSQPKSKVRSDPVRRQVTEQEWRAEGTRLFGPDQMKWRFVCPVCGHIASAQDWVGAGAPAGSIGFACIGRWLGATSSFDGTTPCNYTGGGLFRLNPVTVVGDEGPGSTMFEFAPVEGGAR